MALVAAVSYGVDSLASSINKTEITEEKVNILPPISDMVSKPLQEGKSVMLYVFAEGCSSCEIVKPVIEETAREYQDTVAYIKIDYYQYTSQLIEMGIVSTPTLWVITSQNTNGTFNLLEKFGGSLEREDLTNALDKAVSLLR
jgi:thiol-disulfide isomerase/thioredoxin